MILFCDTSALIKLYLTEAHSDAVKTLLAQADVVAGCRIAWAEACAALSRRGRESPTDMPLIEQARQYLTKDWPHYLIIEVTQHVVEQAGDYADAFALRGYDSVQLAAAHQAQQISGMSVMFACFDLRLNKAAQLLGMEVPFLQKSGR